MTDVPEDDFEDEYDEEDLKSWEVEGDEIEDEETELRQIRKFFVAGVQHHQLGSVISSLEEGDDLDLVPEPENKYDSNAVKIMFGETMLGYVPKTFSAEISGLLELDRNLECSITMLRPTHKPWERLEVEIVEIL